MKKEIDRQRKLPGFSIGVGDLELLWNRMLALFDNEERIFQSLKIELRSETLGFNSVEELKRYGELKGQVSSFSIWLSGKDMRVSIHTARFWLGLGGLSYKKAIVNATSSSGAWVAGALDTVYSFLASHKVWYRWVVAAPLGWILIILLNIPAAMELSGWGAFGFRSGAFIIGWFSTLIALGFLFVFRGKLFPAATLRITEEEGFIRKHIPELSLIIALLSAVLTALGLLLGWGST